MGDSQAGKAILVAGFGIRSHGGGLSGGIFGGRGSFEGTCYYC